MTVTFHLVQVREYETILFCEHEHHDSRNQHPHLLRLGLHPTLLREYSMPLEQFEKTRHNVKPRLERNNDDDKRDRKTRFSSVETILHQRGSTRKQRLLRHHYPVLEHWHIRADGRIWKGPTEFSGVVIRIDGRYVLTQSQHVYKLGTPHPQLLASYASTSEKQFDPDAPLADAAGLIAAGQAAIKLGELLQL